MQDRKVYLDKHTNLLQLEEHMYPLADVKEPNVFRNLFHYDEIPKIAFQRQDRAPQHAGRNLDYGHDIRDGQQSRAPYSTEQIVDIYDYRHRLGGPNGKIGSASSSCTAKRTGTPLYRCMEKGYSFPEITSWIAPARRILSW